MRGLIVRRCSRAFALIESLVALVIVSIGLLGVGGLILASLREAAAALMRTQAVYLVRDMMDRIRANPDALNAYDCMTYGGGAAEHGCASSGGPAVECSARELAEDDLARWQAMAGQLLPLIADQCAANVTYVPATSPAGPARYRVQISWLQPGVASPLTSGGDLLIAAAGRT